jgi:hypothetical protein
MTNQTKAYLGDGVYAQWRGDQIVLTTEDGRSIRDRIVLEPEVFDSLVTFSGSLRSKRDDEKA